MINTEIISPKLDGIKRVSEILCDGGIVAIPTETVYGLAGNALDEKAVKKIFNAKGRPADNPLIVHIAKFEDVKLLTKNIPKQAYDLANKFWPGPLTMIMEKSNIVPDITSGGLDSVAIRMPKNKIAHDIIKYSGLYLAAPSANTSGKPSPTKAKHVINDLKGKVDAIVNGEDCEVGLESTVISLLDNEIKLLRPGKITVEELESVVGKIHIEKAVTEMITNGDKVISPGMKYKHYAPDARIILLKTHKDKSFVNFINSMSDKKNIIAICYEEEKDFIKCKKIILGSKNNATQQAKNLFDVLWKIDKPNAEIVYAHCPDTEGISLAVYNRLIRAAGFEVIDID